MDGRRIVELFAALSREAVRYKVVGGIALNLHGLVRATEDLDLFVDPDPTNVERLRTALKSVFADPEVDQITASDLGGDYPAIQYVPPDGAFSIDILARRPTPPAKFVRHQVITASNLDHYYPNDVITHGPNALP